MGRCWDKIVVYMVTEARGALPRLLLSDMCTSLQVQECWFTGSSRIVQHELLLRICSSSLCMCCFPMHDGVYFAFVYKSSKVIAGRPAVNSMSCNILPFGPLQGRIGVQTTSSSKKHLTYTL